MPQKKFSELHGAADITFFWDLPEFNYVSFSFTSLRKYWPRWLRCFKTFMKWHFFQQFPAFSSWQECITPYLVLILNLVIPEWFDGFSVVFLFFFNYCIFFRPTKSHVQKFFCFFLCRLIFLDKFHVFHLSYFFVSLDSFYMCWNLLKDRLWMSFVTS